MSDWILKRLALFLMGIGTAFLTVPMTFAADPFATPVSSIASINFWKLNDALSVYQQAAKQQPWPTLADNLGILKKGVKDPAVLDLRQQLKLMGDLPPSLDTQSEKFDSALKQAVANFQNRLGLKADGVVGAETRAALNIPPDMRLKQIAINMQRWANLADKLGNRYIMVNIPDFHMYLIDGNETKMTMRAIVGKRDLPTPELISRVTRIVLNPYWNIPPKIAQRDIAPKMIEDPGYMQRMHIRALQGEDGYQVSPSRINWYAAEENGVNYQLRQDPGPDNALGLVKFEFQNSYNVYMHDTPAKDLFDSSDRDLSHGCIRLENPFALVQYLLKDAPEWDEQRISSILDDGQTRYISVPKPIPIFITYLTAWVDDQGRINFRDDIYDQDILN